MDYKRPIRLDETGKVFSLLITYNEEIEFDDIKTVFPFSYISKQTTKENSGKFNHYNSITRKRYEKFVRLKSHCIILAERLNDNLRNFIRTYYTLKGISTTKIYDLDFLKLRDVLSECLQKDKKLRSVFKDGKEKKKYTTTFTNFIEDRNIYVHGDLHLRLGDGVMIIFHKDKKGELASEVNEEIIQSFLHTCIFLNDHINKFWNLANTDKL